MKEVLVVAGDARIPRRAASEAMSLKSVQVMGQQNKQIKKSTEYGPSEHCSPSCENIASRHSNKA